MRKSRFDAGGVTFIALSPLRAAGTSVLLLLVGFALLGGGGLAALAFHSDARRASLVGASSAAAGSAAGLAQSTWTLATGAGGEASIEWGFPGNHLAVGVDGLSALFLAVLFIVTLASAVFGAPYLLRHAPGRPLGGAWFNFNALVLSMAVVVASRNGLLFLIAWETMALSSFFLVMFDAEQPSVRRAGWTYLAASHLGTGCVLAFFAVLGARAGSLDFDRIAAVTPAAPVATSLLFLLAIAGFGTKAGFVPLHVWLPEAHPAAPAHVSALMSGAMIKIGIYGVLRSLTFLGPPPLWWGWLLIGVGASSGIIGVVYALAQHDLKRLLAYHSVENIGIIALGMGVGLVGVWAHSPAVAAMGFAGALLHVLNHGVFKALLFLGAGAVHGATGTLHMEELGGLMKRMPKTGASFTVGSAAIAGLPPLNGFASEFLVFSGALAGAVTLGPEAAVPLAAAAGALALIGGLAAACFVKATGIVFLGEPRSPHAGGAKEAPGPMVAAQLALASLCVGLGLGAPVLVAPLMAGAGLLGAPLLAGTADGALSALQSLSVAGAFLVLAAGLLYGASRSRLRRTAPASGPTWDCGYAAPDARMQYTASSFAAPLTGYFAALLRTRGQRVNPAGPFPQQASLATETPDAMLEHVFSPSALRIRRALGPVLRLQNGRVQFYVLYLVAALAALFFAGMV